MREASGAEVRPILKWAGGKRQLLPALRRYYPQQFTRYFEPFLGSGAVFLDLHNQGRLGECEVRLSDVNADIIGCYRMVRDAVDEVIEGLQGLERQYRAGGRDHYYEVRDGRFNPLRRAVYAEASRAEGYTPLLAAMLIFLNRTGYNGLFRVNSRGEFNVPHGRHSSLRICDAQNLRRLSAALRRPGVHLDIQLFHSALEPAGAGDFIYLDPPYVPLSRTAQFTAYTAAGFGPDEQAVLQRSVIDLASRGAHVLLSNSAAPAVRRLYAESAEARSAGLQTRSVPARRAINSRASSRGAILEYLITNVARC
jgi:DNA adenine methylase